MSMDGCVLVDAQTGEGVNMTLTTFGNGEVSVTIDDDIRDRGLVLTVRLGDACHDRLIALQLLVDAIRRRGGQLQRLVIPYLPYLRQDRTTPNNHALSAKVIAQLLDMGGADEIVLLHPHSVQVQGYFATPVRLIDPTAQYAQHRCATYADQVAERRSEVCVVAPDAGAVKLCRGLAEAIDAPLVCIEKQRAPGSGAQSVQIWGEVSDRTCVIYDDMIDGGGTMTGAIRLLYEAGASAIYVYTTHGIFSGRADERFAQLYDEGLIQQVIVSDSIDQTDQPRKSCVVVDLL